MVVLSAPVEIPISKERNSFKEVDRFMNGKHNGKVRYYNLCSESKYTAPPPTSVKWAVKYFPVKHGNPPEFKEITDYLADVFQFLNADPANVVATYCLGGMGRSCVMVAALLLYSKTCLSAASAIELFASKRTMDKNPHISPSQFRYVEYLASYLVEYLGARKPFPFKGLPMRLDRIRLHYRPNFSPTGGCCE